MNTRRLIPMWLLLTACEGPQGWDPEVERVAQAFLDDSLDVYGEKIQGRSLTGEATTPLLGIAYQQVTLQGRPVTGVRIVSGRLEGTQAGLLGLLPPRTIVGRAWEGALFMGRTATGTVPVRIDAVRVADHATHVYELSRQVPSKEALLAAPVWQPFCDPNAEKNTEAIPVAAVWSQKTGDRIESGQMFTFACSDGVIAKCYDWGYRPFLGSKVKSPVVDAHWACTRAARADYCGNGQTNTLDGTEINIFDALKPTVLTDKSKEFGFEAGWSKEGATCLTHLRWQSLTPECNPNADSPPAPVPVPVLAPVPVPVIGPPPPAIPPILGNAKPLAARGPYLIGSNGRINPLLKRVCDTPTEAGQSEPGVVVFTESFTHVLKIKIPIAIPSKLFAQPAVSK